MFFPKFYPGAPGSPASALNSPGNPSCTPPNPGSAGTTTYVPGPPRGQTQLQVLPSPRAPCGGASGGGGRHLFCGTPGGTSSQRARRTPSPHPLPPPACATRRTGQIQTPQRVCRECWTWFHLRPSWPPQFPTHPTPAPSRWENLGGLPGGGAGRVL